ncbi:MAG: Discoidin domain protein, partial [Solirubrobacterales bacterium]|nr:Discoidin domain protein [Solirubrobacterales bacterium]
MRRSTILACLAALVAAAPARSDGGFLAAPTDQLTVPGEVAGAEITPEGYVYTGAAEYPFRFGPHLVAWDARTRERAAGRYPVLTSRASAGGVRYVLTTFADEVSGAPVVFVHVDALNAGGHPALARWSTATRWSGGRRQATGRFTFRYERPSTPAVPGLYVQPGEPFAPRARHAIGGGVATRDGRVLYAYAGRPAKLAAGPRQAAAEGTRFTRSEYRRRLAPGASASFDLRIPVTPRAMTAPEIAALRTTSFAAHRLAVIARWRAALAGGTVIELPERAVADAWRASVVQLLEPRYVLDGHWVQAVNQLQYHSFWLRDTAIIAQALDLAGIPVPAREDLEYFAQWQQADGLFISRPAQMDGLGQALWGLGEHVRLSGDAAFAAAQLPGVQRAVAWLQGARAKDPLGLVPPSDPHDNELVAGHLAGDDFWAVAGLDAAADLADAAARPDLAAAWRAERDDLRATVTALLRKHGGAIPPALDAHGGNDWGNLWAAWPYPVLAPGDAQVTATLRRVRNRFAEGIATYGASLHGYVGFRVFETELARGAQRKVVDGLYAELAHLTSTDGCFEMGTRPYGRRLIADNLAPHAWCSAELVALLRNMLVRERADGLQLLAALSPAWLGRGRLVAVRSAPTSHGPVDVALRSTASGATLRW